MKNTNGFIKVEKWVLDELKNDFKSIGFYTVLLGKLWHSKEPFIYRVNGREYEVLAGQLLTSYHRIKTEIKISHALFKKIIASLEAIHAIKIEWLIFNHSNGTTTIDALKITSLTPFRNLNYPYSISEPPSFRNQNPPRSEIETLNKNYSLERINIRKDTTTVINLPLKDSEGTPAIFESKPKSKCPKKPKKVPPVADNGSGSTMTPNDLQKLWNDHCGDLPKCRVLSDKRKVKCNLRLKENGSIDYWRDLIVRLSKSDFALNSNWCSFDWIIKSAENHDKAHNGNYDNRQRWNPNAVRTNSEEIPW